MRLATLGPEGTFSHELALEFGAEEIVLLPTIRAVFELVERERVVGIVPIENSEAGGVGATMDALQQFRVFIVGEVCRPIHHHLGSRVTLEEVRVIYAHPQTHEQCSEFLDSLRLPVIHTRSNAESALQALHAPSSAAVISARAAERYGIPIIRREIQNSQNNVTRFILISDQPRNPKGAKKCSIIIDPRVDRVGLLHDLLEVFAKRGVNLTRIESRPSKRGMGSYIFFVDFDATGAGRDAVEVLKLLSSVKELGCYREVEPERWR